jgi:S-adenosylmethionine synthetase
MAETVFASESVTEGHPDKLCDQMSDAIVDRVLRQAPTGRVVAECAVSTAIVFLAVHVDRQVPVDLPGTARDIIRDVGYDQPDFDWRRCTVMTSLAMNDVRDRPPWEERLEAEVDAAGPDTASDEVLDRLVAHEQATVFGYACTQSEALLPLPIWLAHRLVQRLGAVRRAQTLPYLGPDGKVQVGVQYRDGTAIGIHGITLVVTGDPGQDPGERQLHDDLIEAVVTPVFSDEPIQPDGRSRIAVNPDGRLARGGPAMHAGLTGRKSADDTYGAYSRNGSSALSGKDPSRVDRSAAYAARHVAKNVVAAGLARECEVQLSYAIGLARPVSVLVRTFGTGQVDDEELIRRVTRAWDLRPAAIVRDLGLRNLPRLHAEGFYRRLAAYGHVGRVDLDLPWERTDRTELLR